MEDGACPECGAAPPDGTSCQILLHQLLERKYAAEGAEYGLAVACYTLQHPARQTAKALEWARFHLTLAVQHGLPLEQARRAARARFDQRRFRAPAAPAGPPRPEGGWRVHPLLGPHDPGRPARRARVSRPRENYEGVPAWTRTSPTHPSPGCCGASPPSRRRCSWSPAASC